MQSKGFRGESISQLVHILKSYAANEEHASNQPSTSLLNLNINQTQTASINQQISNQVLLNIEYSNLSPGDKNKAKELLNEINDEVSKPETNWQKVTDLLKKGLDFGLKVGLPLAEFVSKYYQAKVTP